MKQNLLLMAAVLMGSIVLTSCETDDFDVPESADDKLPLPEAIENNKDLSVKPGDSFFDYCNGSWLKRQTSPATGAIGGIYDAVPAMDQRVETLKKENAEVKSFFQLHEAMYTHEAEARSYIEARKSQYAMPAGATQDDALRAIGRLLGEGLDCYVSFSVIHKNGIFVATLVPTKALTATLEQKAELAQQLIPLTRAAGTTQSVASLILEGMGINPATAYIDPSAVMTLEKLRSFSAKQLYDAIATQWDELLIYESEAALDTYNEVRKKSGGKTLTTDMLKKLALAYYGYTLSYHLQQRYITETHKQKLLSIVKDVQAALRLRLQQVDWMSASTRNKAVEKLDACGLFVDYPDTWHEDGIVSTVSCKSMSETVHKLVHARTQLYRDIMGTDDAFTAMLCEIDPDNIISLDLAMVNAFYSPEFNSVFIYPALFMEPAMHDGYSEAYLYAHFSAIGHEFTHAFDPSGSKYDKMGNMANWWTVADKMTFEERVQNLINCYSHLEIDPQRYPGMMGLGSHTQTENVADLGGFLATLDAYKARLDAQGFSGDAYRQQLRKFYECYGNLWCVAYNDDFFNARFRVVNPDNEAEVKTKDVHSPARLRINGVVMNTDLWYDLYGIDRNSVLYLPKDRRTYVW